ncbi:hypothetical protein [Hydrogenophaga sp. NH-16]|uniref:hypothetical protein n=1 Tax=Hydrogenophaga sp. NH-16 TaxID=2184519 RepID=UPI000FD9F6D7|nr:hypothetical protein [Hydrogenophaga sp. NH-16]
MTQKKTEAAFPLLVKIYFGFLIGLVLACVAYSIATRTLEDYLLYTGVLTGVWMLFFVHFSLSLASQQSSKLPEPNFRHFIRVISSAVPSAIATYGIGVVARDAYPWLLTELSGQGPVVVGLAALLFGLLLFAVRQWSRILYGVSEVIVGVVVAVYRHAPGSSIWNPDAFLLLLTAGIYLVVRGLDNIQQGRSRNPPDPIARLWGGLFKRD